MFTGKTADNHRNGFLVDLRLAAAAAAAAAATLIACAAATKHAQQAPNVHLTHEIFMEEKGERERESSLKVL